MEESSVRAYAGNAAALFEMAQIAAARPLVSDRASLPAASATHDATA